MLSDGKQMIRNGVKELKEMDPFEFNPYQDDPGPSVKPPIRINNINQQVDHYTRNYLAHYNPK